MLKSGLLTQEELDDTEKHFIEELNTSLTDQNRGSKRSRDEMNARRREVHAKRMKTDTEYAERRVQLQKKAYQRSIAKRTATQS